MIKGINRQIIEVQNTGNMYYERAYLIVKPEYDNAERTLLEQEARKILKKIDAPSAVKKQAKGTAVKAAAAALCFLLGGGISYLIFQLL